LLENTILPIVKSSPILRAGLGKLDSDISGKAAL
jgi:hypothetical protein